MVMDVALVQAVVVKAVEVALLMSLPFLGISLIVGIVVSLIQSVTQIQEQTLTFVPKLVVVMLVMVLTLPWELDYMGTYMYELFSMVEQIRP